MKMEKVTVKGFPMHNPVHACIGCEKVTGWTATGYVCPVYAEPHKVYAIRVFGVCPFNNNKIGIVKALLQYDAYMKYAPILRKIPNMDSQLKSIIISIGQYYEKYDEKSITVDSLREFYYYLNPQAADREMLEYFFTNISEMDVSDAVLGDLLNQVVMRSPGRSRILMRISAIWISMSYLLRISMKALSLEVSGFKIRLGCCH
jgi:hypothetical protein